ncbi:MAG: GTPase Era [Acidaminococcus sp.]|nr:GTPase Era [Acidaminococcus sp.]MDY4559879.1 GTPase Era [Eubacteriales bacterium]MDY5345757.1 GTPase Era [Eubacteriales bacterium]
MKSGFICIAGLPNAGKSTLINTLVGEKVAIVSWRPQTTRNNILGILNLDDAQLVFVDTPGFHKPKNTLGDYMNKTVTTSVKDADCLLYVIDAAKGLTDADNEFLENQRGKLPTIIALNKQDSVTRETLFKVLQELNKFDFVKEIIPVSAKKGNGTDVLLEAVKKIVPDGEKLFPDDMYTDRTLRFMAQEIIREKGLYLLDKEIPYGLGVEITEFKQREDKPITDVSADIIVEKQSHKAIVIGKGGSMLKQIATNARVDLEELIGTKVFLTLYVKVKPEWRNSEYLMRELGYDVKDVK